MAESDITTTVKLEVGDMLQEFDRTLTDRELRDAAALAVLPKFIPDNLAGFQALEALLAGESTPYMVAAAEAFLYGEAFVAERQRRDAFHDQLDGTIPL